MIHQEVLIFEFSTDGQFSGIEVWLERYEYGTSVEQLDAVSIIYGGAHPFAGQLSILINQAHQDNTVWAFTLFADGALTQNTLILPHANQYGLPSAMTRFTAPRPIQAGAEIILLGNHFSRERGGPTEGWETREQYSYSYAIKARFV